MIPRRRPAMKLPVVFLLLLSSSFLDAQAISSNSPSESPLATLLAHPDKTTLKLGEDISVALTLRAGARGAYVSKWSTCTPRNVQDSPSVSASEVFWCGRHVYNVSGFDVFVQTLTGENALPMGHGGSADRWGPSPSPTERFEKEFLFLKSDEQVTWHGSAGSSPTKPGKYQVVGVYIADQNQVRDLVGLPEAQGLLIADTIRSAPVTVEIK